MVTKAIALFLAGHLSICLSFSFHVLPPPFLSAVSDMQELRDDGGGSTILQ